MCCSRRRADSESLLCTRAIMPTRGCVVTLCALTCLAGLSAAAQPGETTRSAWGRDEQRKLITPVRQLSESLATCTTVTVSEHITAVNQECCYAVDGTPLDCNAGPPVQCTASSLTITSPALSSSLSAALTLLITILILTADLYNSLMLTGGQSFVSSPPASSHHLQH